MVAQDIQPTDRAADIRFLQEFRAAVNEYLMDTDVQPASAYPLTNLYRRTRLGNRYLTLRQAINQGKFRARHLLAEAGCRPMIMDSSLPPSSKPVIVHMLDPLLNNLLTYPLPPPCFLDPLDQAIGWLQWRHALAQMEVSQSVASPEAQPPDAQPDSTAWALEVLAILAQRFPYFVAQLAQRHNGRPSFEITDEYDVQDLFHALFEIYFDDIRAEEPAPSHAGSSTRIDFMLANEGVMIEIKMTRQGLAQRGIKQQLLEDIPQYCRHPNCRAVVAFVYDPDRRIRDWPSLENDLSHEWNGTPVAVYVVR